MQDSRLAYSNAEVVVKLQGWDNAHSKAVAQAALSALKQLILSDKNLPGILCDIAISNSILIAKFLFFCMLYKMRFTYYFGICIFKTFILDPILSVFVYFSTCIF